MSPDRNMHRSCCALGAALALAATTAFAERSASPASNPRSAVIVAVADGTMTTAGGPGSTTLPSHPSSETGVRRAAAQGPEELRRYIWRTRMIYNYAFSDFAKEQ